MLTRTPACTSASAVAAPMPVPAPVTSACALGQKPVGITLLQPRSGGAREIGLVLLLAGQILLRPGDRFHADPGGLMQRPGRIGQMRTGDGAQIGAAGGDDANWRGRPRRSRRRRWSRCRPRCGSGRRTASGNSRPYTGWSSAQTWPDEQSIRSAPASLNSLAKIAARRPACCRPRPSRGTTCAPRSASRSGHTARIARNTSSG